MRLDLNACSTAAPVYYKIVQRVNMYIVLDVRLSIPVRLPAQS